MVWYGMVWFGLVWFGYCFGTVWVLLGCGQVYDMVWYGMIWGRYGLVLRDITILRTILRIELYPGSRYCTDRELDFQHMVTYLRMETSGQEKSPN
jgi:hypothetical protein